jgi:hypothetical protein
MTNSWHRLCILQVSPCQKPCKALVKMHRAKVGTVTSQRYRRYHHNVDRPFLFLAQRG